METWKDIPGFEGIYQASNVGHIRTHENKTTYTERHGVRKWKQRVLKFKGFTPKTGYKVDLWKNGKPHHYVVARLIALTFIGEPPSCKHTVNHKDGNRMNNNVENLEWLTLADNLRHAFENDLIQTRHKIALVFKDGIEVRCDSKAKASMYLGYNQGYIHNCLKNNRPIKSKSCEVVEIKELDRS